MEEKTNNLTTVAYSKNRAKELTSICKKLSISKAQFIDATIHQYYRTGEDPREPIKDSLPKKLTAIENKIISFIKVQDSKYLEEIVKELLEVKRLSVGNWNRQISIRDKELKDIDIKTTTSNTKLAEIKQNLVAREDNAKEYQKQLLGNQVLLDANFTLVRKEIEISNEKKQKAIEQVQGSKGMTGTISANAVIEIISNM